MATFEAQVEGLTGLSIDGSSSPTQGELTQFLTDGAKEVMNHFSDRMLQLCSAQQTFTSGTPNTLNTGNILNVFRNDGTIDQPCRRISASLKGRASDSSEMIFATSSDPVFFIDNNTIDVLPASASSKYSEVQYPTVAFGDATIAIFPDEAEYLVVLYACIKTIEHLLVSEEDIELYVPILAQLKDDYNKGLAQLKG